MPGGKAGHLLCKLETWKPASDFLQFPVTLEWGQQNHVHFFTDKLFLFPSIL
jgi:hypothetical protein